MHLWTDWLAAPGRPNDPVEWLDGAERERAAAFRFEGDRRRFVARRTFLRRVLAGNLDLAPGAIRYRTTGTGRPELDPAAALSFSASHADGLAIVAVAAEGIVGADIERVREIPDVLDLAGSVLARRERDQLHSVRAEERSLAFLLLWTRKEAYVKALGLGMSVPFDGFEVLDDHPDGPRVLGGQGDCTPITLAGLDSIPGYAGAVALLGAETVGATKRSADAVITP